MKARELVERYFEYVNAGRWDDYLGLFADDVVMDEQLSGHIEGIEALAKGIEGLRTSTFFKNHPLKIVAEQNLAMATWRIETVGPNGERIEAKGANYFEIENGKIKYFANFHDTVPFKPITG
jgi:ketosteroid isomerase-like protein